MQEDINREKAERELSRESSIPGSERSTPGDGNLLHTLCFQQAQRPFFPVPPPPPRAPNKDDSDIVPSWNLQKNYIPLITNNDDYTNVIRKMQETKNLKTPNKSSYFMLVFVFQCTYLW